MAQQPQRGGPNRPLGVARLEGDIVDFADLLKPYGGREKLPAPLDQKESLEAEFCPVTDEGLVQCPESPTGLHAMNWADSAPRRLTTPGLKPGLYLMVVCYRSGAGVKIRSGMRALILVTSADRFAVVQEEWKSMQQAVSVGAKGDMSQADEMLVAGLVSLRRAWML